MTIEYKWTISALDVKLSGDTSSSSGGGK